MRFGAFRATLALVPPQSCSTAPTANTRQVGARTPSVSPSAHASVYLLVPPSPHADTSLRDRTLRAMLSCTHVSLAAGASSGWSCRSRGTEPSTMCLENSAEVQTHGAAPGCRRPCLSGRLDSREFRVGQSGVPICNPLTHAARRLAVGRPTWSRNARLQTLAASSQREAALPECVLARGEHSLDVGLRAPLHTPVCTSLYDSARRSVTSVRAASLGRSSAMLVSVVD